MERTVKDYEVKGEHKLIREITKTYVTVGGEERLWETHRGGQHQPGKLDGETYIQTDMADLPADVKALAAHFWTEEVQNGFQVLLEAQQAEQNDR